MIFPNWAAKDKDGAPQVLSIRIADSVSQEVKMYDIFNWALIKKT